MFDCLNITYRQCELFWNNIKKLLVIRGMLSYFLDKVDTLEKIYTGVSSL